MTIITSKDLLYHHDDFQFKVLVAKLVFIFSGDIQ